MSVREDYLYQLMSMLEKHLRAVEHVTPSTMNHVETINRCLRFFGEEDLSVAGIRPYRKGKNKEPPVVIFRLDTDYDENATHKRLLSIFLQIQHFKFRLEVHPRTVFVDA